MDTNDMVTVRLVAPNEWQVRLIHPLGGYVHCGYFASQSSALDHAWQIRDAILAIRKVA